MKRHVREFLEQEEITAAARSKANKKAHRQKINKRFAKYIIEKAERIEASGNIAGAKAYRDFWRKFPEYRKFFPEED